MARPLQEPAIWFPAICAGSGADVFTERLVEGLQQRGLRAEITWLPHHAEFAPWIVAKPTPPTWANIAHVNTWLPPRFLPPNIPILTTMHHCVHGTELRRFKSPAQATYHQFWIKRLERSVLARAACITAVSRYTAEQTTSVFGSKSIEVIHNGIDLKGHFWPEFKQHPQNPFQLLYVGKWSRRKGVDLLAPIMEKLGPEFELLSTSQPSGPMPKNFHYIGRMATQEALAAAYRQADALLFPTRLEGFGLVALEAQACGLPVVTTRGSALPEVVVHGVTGLLCPPDDIQAFTEAIRLLSNDIPRWANMRHAARQWVEKQFNLETTIDRYIDLYKEVLKRSEEATISHQTSRRKRLSAPTPGT